MGLKLCQVQTATNGFENIHHFEHVSETRSTDFSACLCTYFWVLLKFFLKNNLGFANFDLQGHWRKLQMAADY